MRRLGLVVNPTAGRGRARAIGERVRRTLVARGFDVQDLSGRDAESAEHRARAACEAGLDALIVVGGDGMVGLAANAVVGTDVPVGIVPAGTGNDASAALGLSKRIGDAVDDICRALAARAIRPIDLIEVQTTDAESTRYVVGAVSLGIDAAVNVEANRRQWPRGRARYVRALVHVLPRLKPYGVRIETPDAVEVSSVVLLTVGNTDRIGGGMRITPGANPADGRLSLVTAAAVSRRTLLRLFPRVYRGTHVDVPVVREREVEEVHISHAPSAGHIPPVAHGDGEPLGQVPVTCSVRPGALNVLAAGHISKNHVGTI